MLPFFQSCIHSQRIVDYTSQKAWLWNTRGYKSCRLQIRCPTDRTQVDREDTLRITKDICLNIQEQFIFPLKWATRTSEQSISTDFRACTSLWQNHWNPFFSVNSRSWALFYFAISGGRFTDRHQINRCFTAEVVKHILAKESMDFHSTRAMGDVYAPQPQFSHFNSPARQTFVASSQRATLHYLPQTKKQVNSSWRRYETDLTSSCRREMDAVDEEIITRLCYALELDKLYVLPDLGLSADIVNRM